MELKGKSKLTWEFILWSKTEIGADVFLTDFILLGVASEKKHHFRYTPIFQTRRCLMKFGLENLYVVVLAFLNHLSVRSEVMGL